VITIYDSGIHEGCPYIVMEWIQGETLSDRLKRGPIEWRALMTILRDVSSALAHAAAQGVVHRDMKPDNIMIRESTGTAVVLDFGIAATYEQNEDGLSVTRKDRVTSLGLVMGTPDFIPPESWAGEKTLDGRADVYALGMMMYQALEGRSMWGIVPSGANDFPAFKLLAESAQFKPRPPITAPVPEGVKVLYSLATIANRNDRPWPEGFFKACEELLATNGTAITLDHRSRTLAAGILNSAPVVQSSEARTISLPQTVQPSTNEERAPVGAQTRTPAEVVFRRPSLLIGGLIAIVVLSASIAGAIFWVLKPSAPVVTTERTLAPRAVESEPERKVMAAPAETPTRASTQAESTHHSTVDPSTTAGRTAPTPKTAKKKPRTNVNPKTDDAIPSDVLGR
jgi:serine/threonine protein kinase